MYLADSCIQCLYGCHDKLNSVTLYSYLSLLILIAVYNLRHLITSSHLHHLLSQVLVVISCRLKSFSTANETQEQLKKRFFQIFQMTPKMFLDIVGVITTSKLSILTMSNRVNHSCKSWISAKKSKA